MCYKITDKWASVAANLTVESLRKLIFGTPKDLPIGP